MYVSRSFKTAVSYLIDLFEVTNFSLPLLTEELNKAHLDNVTKVAIYDSTNNTALFILLITFRPQDRHIINFHCKAQS